MSVHLKDFMVDGVFDKRGYKRMMQRQFRAKRKPRTRCPVCTIKLDEEFTRWHLTCSWYKEYLRGLAKE